MIESRQEPDPPAAEAGLQYADLLLFDDILPSDFSPGRTLECGHYLDFFDSALLSLEGWHGRFGNEPFSHALAASPLGPAARARIHRFNDASAMSGRLGFVMLLQNAWLLMTYFAQWQLPFIVQLYPGGAFNLGQTDTDGKLRDVLLSPLCRKVIVTQTISRDYIIDQIGCDPAKVEFIYGGVFDSRVDFDFPHDKMLFGRDKDTLDLCFVARRDANNLAARGFDHFVTVARALADRDPRLRFHVVGDYAVDDLPLGDAAARFTFHGPRPSAFFRTFYPRMDAIVSVTQPFARGPGAFDGFPAGACLEAGFRGVLNCINDPLDLNIALSDGKDVVLLDGDPEHTAERLRDLLATPPRLYDLAYANWRKFHEVFDTDRQLWARTRIIARELMRPEALIVRPRPCSPTLAGVADNVLSYLTEQCRNQADWVRDTERRHLNLMRQYQEQEQLLAAARQQIAASTAIAGPAPASDETSSASPRAIVAGPRPTWRTRYDGLRSRIRRALA